MPRRLITAPGHTRDHSLGNLATWWIENLTVHGPGGMVDRRVELTDEQYGFLLDAYALSPVGRRLYDSAFYSRPKGCDKSGFAAKIALFETFGPARFAGVAKGGETYTYLGRTYAYEAGEPMGRVVKSPYVRILATEEGQTGNTYATILHNLKSSTAPLFELLAWGVAAGKSRIEIPGGGVIEASTSGAASKDGALETFAVFDETHLYVTPQLREMYGTVKENLGKRALDAEPWYLETTTMFAPGSESIAEQTFEYADNIDEGLARRPRLLFDHRWGEVVDLRDEDALRAGFAEAYGDAAAWQDLDGMVARAWDPRTPEARTRRFRLNAVTAADNAWIVPVDWAARGIRSRRGIAQKLKLAWDFVRPWEGDEITLGFDGSLRRDATALIACRVRDRYLFPIHIQQIPDGPESKDWEVDQDAVDAAVAQAFAKYRVVGFYADPPYWQDWVRKWQHEFGDELAVKAGPKGEIAWYTKRDVQMAAALELLQTAIASGTMSHDDDTTLGRRMGRHFLNARQWERRGGTLIGKEKKNSEKKIDSAIAGALAFQACADYLAKQTSDQEASSFVPFSF